MSQPSHLPKFPTITDRALAELRALLRKLIRRPEPSIEAATRAAPPCWCCPHPTTITY